MMSPVDCLPELFTVPRSFTVAQIYWILLYLLQVEVLSLEGFAELPLLTQFDNGCPVVCTKYPKIELWFLDK